MIARLVKSWSITQSGAMISLVWADTGRAAVVDDMMGGATAQPPLPPDKLAWTSWTDLSPSSSPLPPHPGVFKTS